MWHSACRLFAIAVLIVCATTAGTRRSAVTSSWSFLSAVADRASETLTIRGVNFGRRHPAVNCEEHPADGTQRDRHTRSW